MYRAEEMTKPIYFFTKNDPYFELSNFYPQGFEDDGKYWPTVEHYFQAQKFIGEGADEHKEKIRTCSSPKEAKALGQSRKLKLREDWESVKEKVMLYALRKKFQHPKLQQLLLETDKRELVENSPYDRYWGIGKDGQGLNRLGKLLAIVREELQE